MPVTPTYPGVYIEEIPSGVRTLTGVATSITAFIGRGLRGPTDEPVTINSNGDFERYFGGLWDQSTLGFAIRDFYLNGGSQAIVVRLYHASSEASPGKAALSVGDLILEASSPGAWGNELRVRIDHEVMPDATDVFNLSVFDGVTGNVEILRNVSVSPGHPRQVDNVLLNESRLIRMTGTTLPTAMPTPHPY